MGRSAGFSPNSMHSSSAHAAATSRACRSWSVPPAAALERTNAAMSALPRIAREVPGVDGVVYISGFNLLTGQAVSYNGTAFIRLKPWDQRKARSEAVDSLVRTLMGRLNT